MAINKQSFAKKFAENGQRTVWEETQYKLGWETVGIRPPTKEQFNYLFYNIDEKFSFLSDELDRKTEDAAGKGLPVGAVMGFPRAVTNPEGYLKADGSTFAQATYPDLYRVLGGNKLPNLTRSDIGMTAYFPFGDIPDGWIKYDEIAVKVTQSAYPELYRKLVAQYGSIANVKPVDDYFVRNVGSSGQIGQQYPWTVGDHHHMIAFASYGNDDLNLRPLPYENYYPGQVKVGDQKFISLGQLTGTEGGNQTSDKYGQDHVNALNGSYSQKHATLLTWDRAYTDKFTPQPYHQDNTPKYIGMVLCIKAKDSLDDVVMWIKALPTSWARLANDLPGFVSRPP